MSATEAYAPRLKQRYEDDIRPGLMGELQLDSIMQVPRISKITLNMGVGDAKTDAKAMDSAMETSLSRNSYIRVPRNVTRAPTAIPSRNLKLAIDLRARRTCAR